MQYSIQYISQDCVYSRYTVYRYMYSYSTVIYLLYTALRS